MAAAAPDPDLVIEYPNRDKSASKATKAIVVLLLIVSAVVVTVVTIGGWSELEGAQGLQISFVVVYLVMAFFVARWKGGVLPVAAALAIVLGIFAAIATPGWFDRDATGFEESAIAASVLGLLTILIAILQLLLIVFAMQGFLQHWNVEVERHRDGRLASATV